MQYVIEEWDFRDLTLKMRPPVFIPRPETEVREPAHVHSDNLVINLHITRNMLFFLLLLVQELVELVLNDLQMKPGTAQCCLEVGCGSGAISLSLLKSLPQVKIVFVCQ